MSTANRISRSYRARITLLATFAIAVLCLAPSALAGGSNTYRAGTFSCQYAGGVYTSGNVIRVNPPLMTSIVGVIGLADIAWKPAVYRWTNGSWVFYARMGWIDGAASGSTSSGGWTQNFATFQNVRAGYYKVYNNYSWSSNGAKAGSWSPYANGGYYCQF
jgi:hypothetical protein